MTHRASSRRVVALLVCLVCILAASLLFQRFRAPWPPVLAQTTLPDGSLLRLRVIQQGLAPLQIEAVPGTWRGLWLRLPGFLQRQLPGGMSHGTSHCRGTAPLVVNLLVDQYFPADRSTRAPAVVWAILSDSTNALHTSTDLGPWSFVRPGYSPYAWCAFETAPRRAKDWTLQFIFSNATTATLTLPNPSRVTHTASWPTAPLPQTQTNGPRVVTVTNVEVACRWNADREGRRGPNDFAVTPGWSVREPGVDPDAFDRTHLLEDASGNIVREASSWDEPAWKLTTFVQENYHYPFPASRRRSHQTTLPAPGEWSSIPLTPAEAASGLSFIGCFGTGTYRLHTGAVSVLATTNARPFGFATESALDDWTLQTTEPCVFFLSTRGNGATNWTGSTLALVRFSFNGTNWIPCRPDFSFGGGTLQHSSCASWVLPFQMLRASFGAPLHIDLVHRTRQSNVFYIVPPAWKR